MSAVVHPGDLDDPARPVLAVASDHAAPHRFAPHSHLRAQLVYAAEGTMTVTTAEGTWLVPPQQAVWVPPGVVHEVASREDLAMRTLYVHPAALAGLPRACRVVTVPALLRELILEAVRLPTDHPSEGPEARLLAIIPDQLRALSPAPLHLPLPGDRRLRAITEPLIRAPADGRPLAHWARGAGASERTLARLFVRETGMTFGAWRQRLRLMEALSRLLAGQSVTAVALDLGYESPSAFVAMFRRALGAPPARYLRAVRAGGAPAG